jgi:hypothetical protein
MHACVAGWVCGAAALVASAAAPALDFTLGVGPTHNCTTRGVGVRAAALAYLEPAPLLQASEYGGSHYDPGDGNNIGVGAGYADITAPVGRFCLGVFYRTDYSGQASRDALDAFTANHARRPFDIGRTYELAVDSNWIESAGVKVSRVFNFEPAAGWLLQAGATGSLMKGLTARNDQLRGSAVATSGDYAVGTASMLRSGSDYNRSDFNPYVKKGNPQGYGYSVDFGVTLRSPAGYVAEFTVMDALTHVEWQDVPQSAQALDNETIRYDVNFNRQAFIQGQDRLANVSFSIEPRYRAVVSAPLGRGLALVVSDDVVQQTQFPAVGMSYGRDDFYLQMSYDTRTRSVSLAANKGWLHLALTSNNVEPQQASVLGAELVFGGSW